VTFRINIPQRIILYIRIQIQTKLIRNIPFIRILVNKALCPDNKSDNCSSNRRLISIISSCFYGGYFWNDIRRFRPHEVMNDVDRFTHDADNRLLLSFTCRHFRLVIGVEERVARFPFAACCRYTLAFFMLNLHVHESFVEINVTLYCDHHESFIKFMYFYSTTYNVERKNHMELLHSHVVIRLFNKCYFYSV
jgi:hypothetical protein